MNQKMLLKAAGVAVYVYLLALGLDLITNDDLSFAFMFSISTGSAVMAYIDMYYSSKKQ